MSARVPGEPASTVPPACMFSQFAGSSTARRTHFLQAIRTEGVEARIWEGGRTAYASGLQGMTELLVSDDPPDAVFAVTDLLACSVMDALRQRFGLMVPDDIGVIGLDDIEQAGCRLGKQAHRVSRN